MFTEKEAWEFITKSKIVEDRFVYYLTNTYEAFDFKSRGLCSFIKLMKLSNLIDNQTLNSMKTKITNEAFTMGKTIGSYLWDILSYNEANKRILFAKEQMDKLP